MGSITASSETLDDTDREIGLLQSKKGTSSNLNFNWCPETVRHNALSQNVPQDMI